MIPMDVEGMAVLAPEAAPVMLLRERQGERRWLAITIGGPEASAVALAQEKIRLPRPGTIELIGKVVESFGHQVIGVEVTALRDGIFFADLVLDSGIRVSARPSDAVAIGLRAGVAIEVADSVLEVASVRVEIVGSGPDAELPTVPPDPVAQEREVEEFRAALDRIVPEDFGDPPPDPPSDR
ncbi:bifunctional nuclease family protein [Amycolatopsis speibonae]|uniref:Bifunctional nuclease family protein n=1 Tax=Amycolatopsis speibonae TaxID=1450224 RepID=A0ABV7P3M5_9PSEU